MGTQDNREGGRNLDDDIWTSALCLLSLCYLQCYSKHSRCEHVYSRLSST